MTELERIEELMSLYALGVLEGEELKEAEGLIEGKTPEALSMLDEYRELVSMMSYSTPGVAPDPALKKKLISDLKSAQKNLSAGSVKNDEGSFWDKIGSMWVGLGGLAAAAVIAALVINTLSLREELSDSGTRIAGLMEQIASQEKELEAVHLQLAKDKELISFLQDPGVVVVKLTDSHPIYDPGGRVHWDKQDDEALLVGYNLPETPSGKSYQWWIVGDGRPKSAGIFKVGPEGTNLIRIGSISDFGKIQKFMLTLEKQGGSESPSNEVLLTGDSI